MLDANKILSLMNNKFLELIIFPTEQCNFRCTYCYEDFSIGKMKANVVLAIKKLISSRFQGLDVLKISWFGGEPLIAKDIIFEICSHIIQLSKMYPHVTIISGMTTNAYLLNEKTLGKLFSLGVTSYQISLDGTENMHNQTRQRINHHGSFTEIWRNLLAAKMSQINFSILLRIHVTPENAEDLFELLNHIKANFAGDTRFSIFFKAIENLGGRNAGSFKLLHGKSKMEILKKLSQHIGNSMVIKSVEDNGPYVCYAAQTNSFLIRADGRIGKCTVALADERNHIGELLENGTIKIATDRLALWTRGIKSQNAAELSCPRYQLPKINNQLQSIPIVIK